MAHASFFSDVPLKDRLSRYCRLHATIHMHQVITTKMCNGSSDRQVHHCETKGICASRSSRADLCEHLAVLSQCVSHELRLMLCLHVVY